MYRMFVVTILLLGVAVSATNAYCYNDETDPYLLMSSKTAYEFIHENLTIENHPGCKPKQFWILSRHGTRYPSASTINKMLKNGPKLKKKILEEKGNEMCKADMNNLKAWETDITEDDDTKLTAQGAEDLYQMAKRFQRRFPELLNIPYDTNLFQFRSTDSSRTIESALSFAKGLFGFSTVYMPAPITPDPLLQSYENCPEWVENVDGNPETSAQRDAFRAGDHVANMITDVNKRLGFKTALDYSELYLEDIDIMYDLCRYEKAWTPYELSPWCAAFETKDLKVLEYIEDLKYYYGESYGNNINVELGCPPINDMLRRFSDIASDQPQPKGVFYFTHSTMINMALARLGLFHDAIPPTSTNYDRMKDRLYRTSLIGSFASNIAATFYECSEGERYRIKVFVEERPVLLNGCNDSLCSWDIVSQSFADILESCDLSFCRI